MEEDYLPAILVGWKEEEGEIGTEFRGKARLHCPALAGPIRRAKFQGGEVQGRPMDKTLSICNHIIPHN